jgi:hypothetical protein
VKNNKQLTSRVAALTAVGTLLAMSAFAESRPAKETRSRGESRSSARSDRSSGRGESRRSNDSQRGSSSRGTTERLGERSNRSFEGNRSFDRGRSDTRAFDRGRSDVRTFERSNGGFDARRGDSWRGDSRFRDSRGGFGNRTPFFTRGRISEIRRFNDGFRIFIGGAPYPFFVPEAFFLRSHFRVGLTIGLGGYYNPLGYYDYYDGAYPVAGYAPAYSDGALRGVVESVDYRRNTFVMRNEVSGSFVTVSLRDRRGDVRPGDYVEIAGDWTRSGLFEAYNVAFLDDGDRRR